MRKDKKSRNDEMKKLRFEEGWTFKELAKKYGITRQRVHQIVGGTGHEKSKLRKRKILQMKSLTNKEISKMTGLGYEYISKIRANQRHAQAGHSLKLSQVNEEFVARKLSSLGIKNTFGSRTDPFDILTESNVRISVISRNRSSYSTQATAPYRFRIRKNTRKSDFLVLVVNETKDMFIVPRKHIPKYDIITFCWPARKFGSVSQWLNFHGRFDLLKGKMNK